jgi:hypothetical protein
MISAYLVIASARSVHHFQPAVLLGNDAVHWVHGGGGTFHHQLHARHGAHMCII